MITITCDQCGKEYMTYPSTARRSKQHFCCKRCERESKKYNNTRDNWRGGHLGKTTGYIYIRIDGKDVGEHVLVAEKMIGRRLKKGEVVHHINGNKTDNRPENLQVMTNSEHVTLHGFKRGRTRKCLKCGCIKKLHGRELCGTCYHQELVKGELNKWQLNTIQKKSNMTE